MADGVGGEKWGEGRSRELGLSEGVAVESRGR